MCGLNFLKKCKNAALRKKYLTDNLDIKEVSSIQEFLKCIENVKKTNKSVCVRHKYKVPVQGIANIDIRGILTKWHGDYEEITPL